MSFRVRQGRADDLPWITSWTTDTFSWGDYVPDRIEGWLEDPESELLVCSDESDVVRAIVHAEMLSPAEGWLEAARVHPDHRRTGMGTALNRAGVEWLAQRGARVVRLATEADNEPAVAQVACVLEARHLLHLARLHQLQWRAAGPGHDHRPRRVLVALLRPAAGAQAQKKGQRGEESRSHRVAIGTAPRRSESTE